MQRLATLTLLCAAVLFVQFAVQTHSDATPTNRSSNFTWQRLTEHAPFPGSYNFPVHKTQDGQFVALHPQGTWVSSDGQAWTKSSLPFSGMNAAYLRYVQHGAATWALGKLSGNYQAFSIDPTIQRTTDYQQWTTVGSSPSLPKRVFYAVASFRGALWILGGFDGSREMADVWRSVDGLRWVRVVEHAPWSARASATAVVFRDRLFLIGGGRIDGPISNDVWSSADGLSWTLLTSLIAPEKPLGYTPVVYADQLWLIGANRSGQFTSEMLVSSDGKFWHAQSAPWSARGGVAAWANGVDLYITGGKYSTVVRGETVFQYGNDVWRMSPKRSAKIVSTE
jgi:hypothetical protein